MQNNDASQLLQQSVVDALKSQTALSPAGGGSKAFLGRTIRAEPLYTGAHQGIVNYQPSELTVTVRSGTRLPDLEKVLAEQGQMLAFEPPVFSEDSTVGGVVAAGLSGPRRAFSGSVRDFVLGCKIINGKGEILGFGGEVMKNVAGYDVSRLMAGSMGTLGLILDISFKVLPLPKRERTLCFQLNDEEAMQKMSEWTARCLPVSGLSYDSGILRIRLSGHDKAVNNAAAKLGGEAFDAGNDFWRDLNNQRLSFFERAGDLWRISLPPANARLPLSGDWLIDWGGALRWLKTDEPAERIFEQAGRVDGHAMLFKGRNHSGEVYQPLSGKLLELHKNLKNAFDPQAIFNPGRMSKDW